MALRIRLRRMGRKNAPTYRIVVAESTMPRDGRIVENLGHYNPRTEPATLAVNRDRALHWLGHGATPTTTVSSLLRKAGVFRPAAEEPSTVGAVAEAVKGAAKGAVTAVQEAAAEVAERVQEAVTAAAGEESSES